MPDFDILGTQIHPSFIEVAEFSHLQKFTWLFDLTDIDEGAK